MFDKLLTEWSLLHKHGHIAAVNLHIQMNIYIRNWLKGRMHQRLIQVQNKCLFAHVLPFLRSNKESSFVLRHRSRHAITHILLDHRIELSLVNHGLFSS